MGIMRNKKIIGSLIILSALTLFSGTSVFAKSKEATYKDGETILPKEAFYESETGNSVGGCDSYTERMIPTPTVKKDDATPTIQPSVTPTPIEDTSVTPTPINTEVPTDTPSQTPTDTPTDEPTVTPTETPLEQDQRIWEGAKLNKEELYRAKTTTYKLQLVDIPSDTGNYTVQWASSNTRVAVDDNGQITAKKTGEAVITAKITTENGYTKTLRCYVTVTNPKFAKSTYIFAKSVEWDLEILGTDTTVFSISSSNTSVVKVY